MVTPWALAAASEPDSGLTLKPITRPLLAAASITSDSVIAPTPLWMMSTPTLGPASLVTAWATASTEPCTSPFSTRRSSLASPVRARWSSVSSVSFTRIPPSSVCRSLSPRWSAISLAAFSSSTTLITSPAVGTPESPTTSAG